MDGEQRSVSMFLHSKGIRVSSEWLEECIQFFRSEQTQRYSMSALQDFVLDQWSLTDLRETGTACLPPNLSQTLKITLSGKFALQVESAVDIAQPAYSQLQKLRKVNTENVELTVEHKSQSWEPRPTRVLQLSMCDGVQDVKGIEYKPIRKLDNSLLIPGCKVVVIGPVVCRRGVFLLEEHNLQLIGGEVDSLLVPNALENILARKLNLEENPNPYSGSSTSLTRTSTLNLSAPVVSQRDITSTIAAPISRTNVSTALRPVGNNNSVPVFTTTAVTSNSARFRTDQALTTTAVTSNSARFRTDQAFTTTAVTSNSARCRTDQVLSRVQPQRFHEDLNGEIIALEHEFHDDFFDENDDMLNDKLDNHFASLENRGLNFQRITPASEDKETRERIATTKGCVSASTEKAKNDAVFHWEENMEMGLNDFDPFEEVFTVDDHIMNEFDDDFKLDDVNPVAPDKSEEASLTKPNNESSTVVSETSFNANNVSNVSNISSEADLLEEDDDILLGVPVPDLNSFVKPIEKPKTLTKSKISTQKRPENQRSITSFLNKKSIMPSIEGGSEASAKVSTVTDSKTNSPPTKRQALANSESSISCHKIKSILNSSPNEIIDISDSDNEVPTTYSGKKNPVSSQANIIGRNQPEKMNVDVKRQKMMHNNLESFSNINTCKQSEKTEEKNVRVLNTQNRIINSFKSNYVSTDVSEYPTDAKTKSAEGCMYTGFTEPKSLNCRPFVYISEILKTSRTLKTYTVKAFVVTLPSRLTMQDNKWNLQAKINDGSASLDVDFSDHVLTEIIGFTCEEFNSLRKKSCNDLIKNQLKEAVARAQHKLINLSGLFDLTFINPENRCSVTRIGHVTSQEMKVMSDWLKIRSES